LLLPVKTQKYLQMRAFWVIAPCSLVGLFQQDYMALYNRII
jgi:hypothetical protein